MKYDLISHTKKKSNKKFKKSYLDYLRLPKKYALSNAKLEFFDSLKTEQNMFLIRHRMSMFIYPIN